jgi:hypothetical protein
MWPKATRFGEPLSSCVKITPPLAGKTIVMIVSAITGRQKAKAYRVFGWGNGMQVSLNYFGKVPKVTEGHAGGSNSFGLTG